MNKLLVMTMTVFALAAATFGVAPAFAQNYISMDQAVSVARAQVGEGYVVKDVEFDANYGKQYYDVELVKGVQEVDVKVDAVTGQVLSVKHDRD